MENSTLIYYIINRRVDCMTEKTLSSMGDSWTDDFISDSMHFETKEEAQDYIDNNFESNEYELYIGKIEGISKIVNSGNQEAK